MERQIGNVMVVAKEWAKGVHRRLYFSTIPAGQGQACWDLEAKKWLPVHGEFGGRFKDAIAAAFGLEAK